MINKKLSDKQVIMDSRRYIFDSSLLTEDYTERVMYATGSHPRYDGTASAHVATVGGRYDYLFDCHDRLVKAEYTGADAMNGISALGGDMDYTENFSTEYTYNSVGVPLTVKRYGVQCIDNSSGTPVESFGVLDNLSYTYDGMLLNSVTAFGSANGEDFYGRTGFPLSFEGGTATYQWNAAGLLNKDSAREITGINYNWNGQPTKITFADKGYMAYSYASTGALRKVETYAMLTGKRAAKVSERTYCGDFVFEGDSLLYANFAGGYFDGAGQPHYRHADFQGNITMVTDCRGQVEQHTGYYPYGEPWREPTGQPYLYGGKERMRDHALNEYDFGARRLSSALCLWTTPDPLASDYAPTSPYSYCAGNPIKFVDPSGMYYTFPNISDKDKDRIREIIERATDNSLIVSFAGDKLLVAKHPEKKETKEPISACVLEKATQPDETILNVENGSEIIIGDADKQAIDLDDIENLGTDGPANDMGALFHEMVEQDQLQHSDAKDDDTKKRAHIKATNIEGYINKALIDPVRIIDDDFSKITFRYNSDRTQPQTKDLKYPNTIIIRIDKNKNIIKKKK